MYWMFLGVILLNTLLITQARPQVPDGFGDTIAAIGGTAAELIR